MVKTVDEDTKPKAETLFCDIDDVIDMFANNITINDGYEITQSDIDNQFVIPTPKAKVEQKLPIVMLNVEYVNDIPTSRPFTCLLDSGSDGCLQNKRSLPFGAEVIVFNRATVHTSTQGTHTSREMSYLDDAAMLPKFAHGRHIKGISFHLFDSPTCPCDIIFGRNFLSAIGMHLYFHSDILIWLNDRIDMTTIEYFDRPKPPDATHNRGGIYYEMMDIGP